MATAPKSGAGPDDIMAAAAAKPLLMMSKREPVSCALGLTADKLGVLLLHKKARPKKVLADLKGQAKKVKLDLEASSLRFGTAEVDPEVDPTLVLFRVNKPVAGLVGPKIRDHLKKAGISKAEFVVDPSLDLEPEEEGPEAGTAAAAPGQAKPDAAEPDWPSLAAELATLGKEIAAAAASNPARKQTLVQRATAANAALKARQDFAAAAADVAALREALHVGIDVAAAGHEDDPLDLASRMGAAARQLNALKADGDPALPSLLKLLGAANAAVKAKAPEAGGAMDELETALARAVSAARGREAGSGNTGKVAYAKLLLRWHDAQERVDANLKALGQALLSDPEIRDDPDFEAIEQGVADLPHLAPELGQKLDDVLDAARDPSADTAALNREALGIIKEYRTRIGAVGALRELEPLAANTQAGKIDLFTEFDTALNDLEAELANAA